MYFYIFMYFKVIKIVLLKPNLEIYILVFGKSLGQKYKGTVAKFQNLIFFVLWIFIYIKIPKKFKNHCYRDLLDFYNYHSQSVYCSNQLHVLFYKPGQNIVLLFHIFFSFLVLLFQKSNTRKSKDHKNCIDNSWKICQNSFQTFYISG